MSAESLLPLMTATPLCLAIPARGGNQRQNQTQFQMPEGVAKEAVQSTCIGVNGIPFVGVHGKAVGKHIISGAR
jgi:hypothetical protein